MKDRIAEALKKLTEDRRQIDQKIAALKLASKLLHPTERALRGSKKTEAAQKRAPSKRARDPHALSKTLAFVKERKRPVTVAHVANHFHVGRMAANQRLMALCKLGRIKRLRRGQYSANVTNVK